MSAQSIDFLIRSFQLSRMLRLVADLGVADKIAPGGHSGVGNLAEACRVRPAPLMRVLRALAAFGVFQVSTKGEVSHSPQSLRLRKDAVKSLHYAARFFAAPGSWHAWGALDAALSGKVPYEVAWNSSRFDYLRDHPDEARLFDLFLAQSPDNTHEAVVASYDFSGVKLIADIGGGNGAALRAILQRYPEPRGLLLDRQDVIESIPESDRLGGRIELEAGNFFDRAPEGANIYLLSRVLHDWSDEDCIRILRVIRAAIPADGRLLIAEHILEPDPTIGNPTMYLLDIQMMIMFGSARERTEAEFNELLTASGFEPVRLFQTRSSVAIIEAMPT